MTCFQKLSCGSSQIRIKALDRELQIFNYFIERVMEKICATMNCGSPQGI
jgi:hypothetical protein